MFAIRFFFLLFLFVGPLGGLRLRGYCLRFIVRHSESAAIPLCCVYFPERRCFRRTPPPARLYMCARLLRGGRVFDASTSCKQAECECGISIPLTGLVNPTHQMECFLNPWDRFNASIRGRSPWKKYFCRREVADCSDQSGFFAESNRLSVADF